MPSILPAVATLLLTGVAKPAVQPESAPAPISFERVDLAEVKVDLSRIGLQDCTMQLPLRPELMLAACHRPARETATDHGLRLFLLHKSGKRYTIKHQSRSYRDAYYVKLAVFRAEGDAKQPIIVVAESGAEFSYGLALHALHGTKLKLLRDLDVTAPGADNPQSALPHILLERVGKNLVVTFDQDMLRSDESGGYNPVLRADLRYELPL